jgi:hypothetical protein
LDVKNIFAGHILSAAGDALKDIKSEGKLTPKAIDQ